jgi:Flp pilus assembly protein TadD
LGLAYEKTNQIDQARKNYWQALIFEPDNTWVKQRWEAEQGLDQ